MAQKSLWEVDAGAGAGAGGDKFPSHEPTNETTRPSSPRGFGGHPRVKFTMTSTHTVFEGDFGQEFQIMRVDVS